ncbi:hypothetical protein GGQ85_003375 [Nitrobacter vulgaris]|jgi:hypothetical protein|nr:hypothetical protein [Nitrobacter vulgaris]
MAAHLHEAAVVSAILADEDRLHRRLHVVVDAATAGHLSTFRTVFRDTFRSRAISLIVLPLMKCSRRIRAIVSTISIPDHLLHDKAGSATANL